MPDNGSSSGSVTERIIFRIIEGAILVTTLIIGCRQTENKKEVVEKVDNVHQQVTDKSKEVLDKQDTTLEKQDKAAKSSKEVKDTLDESLGPQLYSTWRYLQDIAAETGKPDDRQKASEARKAYEDHVRKHTGGH